LKIKHIFLSFVGIVFFCACSAQYEVKKTYDFSNTDKSCINSCELSEKQCNISCQDGYNRCLLDANNNAKELFKEYDKRYKSELYIYLKLKKRYDKQYYIWLKEYKNIEYDYNYYSEKCSISKDKNSYECKKKDYFNAKLQRELSLKPTEPIKIKRVRLSDLVVQEQSSCTLNCGCADVYDRCFSKCGGKITYQKFCISNCDD